MDEPGRRRLREQCVRRNTLLSATGTVTMEMTVNRRRAAECKRYHVPLCRNSELKRMCLNEDCRNHHLRHTRRSNEVGDDGWQVVGKRSQNASSASPARTRKVSYRSRNPSSAGGPAINEEKGTTKEEDFLQRLLERLSASLPALVATEMQRQNSRSPSNVSLQLPPGMTLTQSARG